MRRPVEWNERDEEGRKVLIKVMFQKEGFVWQRKIWRQDGWEHDFKPSVEQWEILLDRLEKLNGRKSRKEELALAKIELSKLK